MTARTESAYRERVREYLPHAYTIPVKEGTDDYAVPGDQLARYHLIFAARSPRAVVLMNDVARNALAPYFRKFTEGLLFDLTPDRYQAADRAQDCSPFVTEAAQPTDRCVLPHAGFPALSGAWRGR